MELSNCVKITFARIENIFDDKMTIFENKLADLESKRVKEQ